MSSPKQALEAADPRAETCFRFKPFDGSGAFSQSLGRTEIGRAALRSAGASTVGQALSLGIQMVSILVLARLLRPADFGLVAMVTTFSLLLVNVGGNGLTEAVIQWKDIDHAAASNLFWINVSVGLLLTAVFAAAGSLMARFYRDPDVMRVAVGISLTIAITSTSVLHCALMMRSMRFPTIQANQVIARFVGAGTAIVGALAGFGYWALVAGAIAQPLSESGGIWTMCRWIPGRPQRLPVTMEMVRFAAKVYGRFSFNYLSRNVDNLLVGWRFNAESLGFYKKAYDLFALSTVLQGLTSVAVSALRRLRDDIDQFKSYLLRSLTVAAFLGMGIGGAVTLCGKDVIRLVLGPKWLPAGEIFTLFGPGFGIMFIYAIHGWIHLSLGRPGRWFRWGIIEFLVTASMFIVGLHWGPVGVATAWSLSLAVLALPSIWYAGRPIKLEIEPVLRIIWKFAAASLLAGPATATLLGGTKFYRPAVDAVQAAERLAAGLLTFAAFYVTAVLVLHRSTAPFREMAVMLHRMLSVRRTTGPPVLSPSLNVRVDD